MSLKGSKTEQNLKDAFAGESQANRRYLYFAAKADVEGQAYANSSNIKDASNLVKPVPLSFSGTYIPAKPSSADFLKTSVGNIWFLSHSKALSAIYLSANCFVESTYAFWSELRSILVFNFTFNYVIY